MTTCSRCGSYAINPGSHGRDGASDLNLCDVCYWRTRAERLEKIVDVAAALCAETVGEEEVTANGKRLNELLKEWEKTK